MRKASKKAIALLLSVIMVLGMAPVSIFASAADGDWVTVSRSSYEPVTVYVKQSSMDSGNTYLVDVGNKHFFTKCTEESTSYSFIEGTLTATTSTDFKSYYTAADGSNVNFDADMFVDEDGTTFKYSDFTWDGSKLKSPETGYYFTPYGSRGSYSLYVYNTSQQDWKYSNNRLYVTYYNQNYYIRYSAQSNGNKYTIDTSTTDANITPYLKTTAYKMVDADVYYKYNGVTALTVDKGSTFDESSVTGGVTVLYKETENGSASTLTLGDSRITLEWNDTVNTAVPGNYTATVYAEGTAVGTVTVTVKDTGTGGSDDNPDPEAGWTYAEGTKIVPKTIYVRTTSMTSGKTYLLGIGSAQGILNTSLKRTNVDVKDAGEATAYYTNSTGTSKYTVGNDYIEGYYYDEEFTWSSSTLYNESTGEYLTYSGTTLQMDSSSATWNYGSNKLYKTISSRTRYIRYSESNNSSVVLGTTDSANTIYPYAKTTVYEKVGGGVDGYYKYNGRKDYLVAKGDDFDEADVLSGVSVLFRENFTDDDLTTLNINDSEITVSWDKPLDTDTVGVYTATVYANGVPIDTIKVNVSDGSAIIDDNAADPSTSDLGSKFPGRAEDDGKILTDKTVQYASDEFDVFDYSDTEFSVALSALGQSYTVVETEETETIEKIHPDVIFVLDASGSMRVYNVNGESGQTTEITRAEATIEALNAAIKELYADDPETRIGIVTFGNDYISEGIYLPLDKYTLPEGQTEYITWGGRMVAKEGQPDVTSFATPLCSGAGGRYFYPTTSSTSTSSTRSYLRYNIGTNGAVTRYNANSYTGSNIGTVADGSYINDTTNGYTIYRKGDTFYVYKTTEFNNALAQANSAKVYNDGAYAVKTESADKTLTLNRIDTWAGYDNGVFNKPAFSAMTKIATTANGVTYYAYTWYNQVIILYSDEYEWPIARMMAEPTNANYTNVYYNEYITIKATSGTSITYSTNTYADKSGVTVSFEPCEYLAATNFLINSKGEVVEPSQYQFVGNIGTYTQAGIQAAENMFAASSNKENRVPALVLISDGIPTIANTNVNNPNLKFSVANGTTVVGTGMTTEEGTSPDLARYGLYTIQTSVKAKNNITNMYKPLNGGRNALYYTIGPGVGYSLGKTILNPTAENIAEAAKITTPGNADVNSTESGVGIPKDLADILIGTYGANGTDVVDYADWSYSGDMSAQELKQTFKKLAQNLTDVTRPLTVTETTEHYISALEEKASMTFTDKLGDSMSITGEPVIVYNSQPYTATEKTTETVAVTYNGEQVDVDVDIYRYNYKVTEPSTGKAYDLNNAVVEVFHNPDGTETVKWFLPSELVPIIIHDTDTDEYISSDPIRLVFKVGLDENAESGTYYTNSRENPANAEFHPAVGNPYYYDNVEDETDGKMHSYLKDDLDSETPKTENRTDTLPDSIDVTVDENGNVEHTLGNNGKITISSPIEILPDVIVVDYGKPILCSPLDNDKGAVSIVGLGAMDSDKYASEYTSQNGVFRISGDNVTFTPFSYMSSINRVRYYAEVFMPVNGTKILNSTIFVIPATTVYYEDNFGGSEANGGLYIQYSGDWYTVNEEGTEVEKVTAKADADEFQDRGEVGKGHTPYGYDSSYDGDLKFSDGTAAVAEGKVVNQQFVSTASFTFTGTGFDIISRTDLDCGMITVLVNDHETGKNITSVPVINKGVGTLYQIPVISYTSMPDGKAVAYGTYDVVINISAPIKYLGITGSTFYLDAIRIYDPMGKSSTDNEEFDEANAAYNTDKEANAFIASIRDFIIQIGNLGPDEEFGAVYVDTINNDYNDGGVIGNIKAPTYTDEQKRWRTMKEEELNTFELVGPNEEVYLTPGKGVGFIVESNLKPESIQLEIKIPSPLKTDAESTLSVVTYGDSSTQKNFAVKSAAEMFYDITDAVKLTQENGVYRATVVLSNGLPNGATANEIVSITNIKMTYADGIKVQSVSPSMVKASASTVPAEPGTLEYAYNAEMEALANCDVAVASLKASSETYKQVFDTVYVQREASTPNYDVVNAEMSESIYDGGYADITFHTSDFVKDVKLLDENGKEISLTDVKAVTDQAKRFSDDYQNAKTWTAKARILKDEGDYAFTVKAVDGEGEAVTMPVTVTPAKVTSLSVESVPAKTEYAYGEEIDLAGITLKAVYSNGEEKVVTEGITLDKTVADENGEMTVTAEFEGTKTEFTVKVTPVLKGIRVAKAPTKTSYKFGTVIDASGLEIIAEYNDGTEKVVSGYTLKDTKADTEGTMKVGVEYEGFETEFSVNVKKTFFQKLVDFFKNIITSITGIFGKKA